MPRKLKKCCEINCKNTTNGERCLSCSYVNRTKRKGSIQEYRKEWNTKKKYNIDALEFEAYWLAFRGKCGICNNDLKLPEQKQGQSLEVVAIDHCHKTGKIRGLLCNSCNKGLGFFKDNTLLLKNAIKWLGEI